MGDGIGDFGTKRVFQDDHSREGETSLVLGGDGRGARGKRFGSDAKNAIALAAEGLE